MFKILQSQLIQLKLKTNVIKGTKTSHMADILATQRRKPVKKQRLKSWFYFSHKSYLSLEARKRKGCFYLFISSWLWLLVIHKHTSMSLNVGLCLSQSIMSVSHCASPSLCMFPLSHWYILIHSHSRQTSLIPMQTYFKNSPSYHNHNLTSQDKHLLYV